MDRLIKRFDAESDADLMLCRDRGVAYQRDMAHRVPYDAAYFAKCRSYEDQEIARRINAGRIRIVAEHFGVGPVLDIGVGSGEFVRKRVDTFGFDINPKAIDWLKTEGLWREDFSTFDAFTFWDVIEHVDEPEHYFRQMPPGSFVFTCLPIFDDLSLIRESKHYRPGEHLYYWTAQGFVDWMALYRFRLADTRRFEIDAGRESILSFAFERSLPGYHDMLAQYQALHAAFYGDSAWLYLDEIAAEVFALQPSSILDFGCGRSDLAAHFWRDGERRIAKYDPAIASCKTMPDGRFDLVLCCDVLEHVLMADVDRVLAEVREKSPNAIFTISMRPARARLPDGRNAHVTLLGEQEWTRWVASVFGAAVRVPTRWDHILMLRTFGL